MERQEISAEGTVLSHALLLTGGDLEEAARDLAAAMECTGAGKRPCGVCPACRKVYAGIHPDVTVVRDPEHKAIAADVVRSVRSDALIRPNEGQRKVYIFPDCALLTEQDQNILLKIVEEGPAYAAFIFCAQSAGSVLPTLRSRCMEVRRRPGEAQETPEPKHGSEICRCMASRKRGALWELAIRLERGKLTREELTDTLAWCREAFAAALLTQYGLPPRAPYGEIAPILAKNLTNRKIMFTIDLLKKYYGDCAFPVGPGHVLGALAAEWEEHL